MSTKTKKKITLARALFVECMILAVVFFTLFAAEVRITEINTENKLKEKAESISAGFVKEYSDYKHISALYADLMQSKTDSLVFLLDHTDRFNEENISTLASSYGVDDIILTDNWQQDEEAVGVMFYPAQISDGRMVIIQQRTDEESELLERISLSNSVLGTIVSDDLYFIVSSRNGYIAVMSDNSTSDSLRKIDELGITLEDLSYETGKWLQIMGKRYYTFSYHDPGLNISTVTCVSYADMTTNSLIFAGLLTAMIGVVYTVIVTYSFYDRQERNASDDPLNPDRIFMSSRKLLMGILAGLIVIAANTYYIQSLYALSFHSIDTEEEKQKIQANLKEAASNSEVLESIYDHQYLTEAQIIARILSEVPELRTRETLSELSGIFDLEYIMLFDKEGHETLSDSEYVGFVISDDPEAQSYEFNLMKNGTPYIIQKAQIDEVSGTEHQFIAAKMTDRKGRFDGFLQICISPTALKEVLKDVSFEVTLYNAVSQSENGVLAINQNTSDVTYYSYSDDIAGQKAQDIGISEEQLRSNYLGYIDILGTRLFADSFTAADNFIYIVAPQTVLFNGRVAMTVLTAMISLLGIIVYLRFFYSHEPVEQEPEELVNPYVDVTTPGGVNKQTLNIVSRVLQSQIQWRHKPSDEKAGDIIRFAMLIVGTSITIISLLRNVLYSETSVFGFITGNRWNKGFNVFALTKSLIFFLHVYLAVTVIEYVLNLLIRLANPRNETIVRLLKSLIKYITVLGVIYYALTQFGFDSQSLLASAGLLTLIIGLGARDLVTDILAGIFIIFENEFQVGDIIEVGGYKGRVVEIGIRTTSLMNTVQDIKSINNRNLTNIVNKTRRNSYCDVIVNVPFDQNIEDIERVLREELPKLKERCPYILEGPTYGGVDDLSGRSMRLSIRTECLEAYKFEVRSFVNGEIKKLFEKNGFKMT